MSQTRPKPAGGQENGQGDSSIPSKAHPLRTAENQFPFVEFWKAAPHLRRPFTAQAIRFKVQTSGDRSALVVPYIDARLVVERLNLVIPAWSDEYAPNARGEWECRLTVGGITRSDVGDGKGKAGYSDAFKRAAVKFGVGVSLYALPKIFLQAGSQHVETRGRATVITDTGDEALRRGYAKWLAEDSNNFGPPLDHGDVGASVGDPADVASSAGGSGDATGGGPEALVEGPEADAARGACREAYAELVSYIGRAAYPPAAFQAELASAGGSLDGLDGFLAGLMHRCDEEAAKKAVVEGRAPRSDLPAGKELP